MRPKPSNRWVDRRAWWAALALAAAVATTIYLRSVGDSPSPGDSAMPAPVAVEPIPASLAPATLRKETEDAASGPAANIYEYLRALAPIAFAGNANAQYQLARELAWCNNTLSLVRKEKDPEAAILNLPGALPQAKKERLLSEYRRCKPLLEQDPFADLPARAGGYGSRYWSARAAEAGHPVALAQRALRDLGDLRYRDKAARDRPAALDDLARAATSGNADALLTMGLRLARDDDDDEGRILSGIAFMIVACQQGADCGSDSRILPVADCIDFSMPECASGIDFEGMLAQALGPEKFAAAYAESQRLAQDLHSRETLQPWLELF